MEIYSLFQSLGYAVLESNRWIIKSSDRHFLGFIISSKLPRGKEWLAASASSVSMVTVFAAVNDQRRFLSRKHITQEALPRRLVMRWSAISSWGAVPICCGIWKSLMAHFPCPLARHCEEICLPDQTLRNSREVDRNGKLITNIPQSIETVI